MTKMIVGASAMALAAQMRAPEFGRKDGVSELDSGDMKKLAGEVSAALKQVQEFAAKTAENLRKGEDLTAETKSQIDDAMTKFNTLSGIQKQVDELVQKAERFGGRDEQGRTAGQRFVEAEEFKNFAGQSSPRGRVVVEVKDISSLTTDAPGSVGTMVQPDRASPVMLPQRRMTIRALLAPGSTSSNQIEYDKEVGFTNNAAPVAEGALKPQSEIQMEEATANVRTIAHWMRASVQILSDAPGLRSMIDQRLRYGLAFKEEEQLLNGSGSSQNLSGLVTEASAFSAAFDPDSPSKMIDIIRLAILQVALAEYPANGIVLNPIDWAFMELLKDGDGRYLIGNPQGTTAPTLWGLPVVPTQAMTEDKFLVGAFDLAAQIFDRQNATVEVSTEDQDNFVKNKVTIRAEERLALAVYRPEALVYGDLGRVA